MTAIINTPILAHMFSMLRRIPEETNQHKSYKRIQRTLTIPLKIRLLHRFEQLIMGWILQMQQLMNNRLPSERCRLVQEVGIKSQVPFAGAACPLGRHRTDGNRIKFHPYLLRPGPDFGLKYLLGHA